MSYLLKLFILSSIFFILTSCGDNDDSDCDTIINTGVLPFQDEQKLFEVTGQEFSADQTKETCEAYVQSARDLIAAMKLYGDCLSGDELLTYNTRLSETEKIPDSIDCDF